MCYCVTPESAQPYETAYLAASGKMMPAATASLAELRYALLTSLSVLGAAEAITSGCSVRAQLIAWGGRGRHRLLSACAVDRPRVDMTFAA